MCSTIHFEPFFLVKEASCEMKEDLKRVLDLPSMSWFVFMNQATSQGSRIKRLLYYSFHSSRISDKGT